MLVLGPFHTNCFLNPGHLPWSGALGPAAYQSIAAASESAMDGMRAAETAQEAFQGKISPAAPSSTS